MSSAAQATPLTLTRAEVARMLGMPVSRLRREVAEGRVPPPLALAGRQKLWSRAHIDAWLAPPESRPRDSIMEAIDGVIAKAERGRGQAGA